jgi:hypothetical protein
MVGYAKLNKTQVEKLQSCEKEMDSLLVAYEKPVPLATLTPDQLKKIQGLEKEIGVVLVAFG